MSSLLIVPIRIRDTVTGTLTLVAAESGRRYDEIDVALAEELGRRAGIAIENSQLYAAERRAREQVEIIARASETFSETLHYEETLRTSSRWRSQHSAISRSSMSSKATTCGASPRPTATPNSMPSSSEPPGKSARNGKHLSALDTGELGFYPVIDDAWRREVATSPEHLAISNGWASRR